ncbi:hypothetical protein FHT70_006008 [Rhizobium sp. BK049]|uniref:ThiF family adenylyltransferase n=1 Tax=Rhizobium sp. BK049 TaxID=2587095 RepID=UPI0016112859|nr:ThiF family adenylyltransferase [Rhizobium sp. BK049]MBB3356035.1 hypothetical protein [Rhizobium sp. BK049]
MNAHISLPDRQAGILDRALLKGLSLLQIGVGRGIMFTELMASSGLKMFTAIDPDVVSPENVGQSGHVAYEVGQTKVGVACNRVRHIDGTIQTRAFFGRAEHLPNIEELMLQADLIKVGTDSPDAQFALADMAQRLGVPALACGTMGDNSQWYAALLKRGGPSLAELLPEAWEGLQAGRKPPAFFRSCRLNADSLNIQVARLALGLIHFQAGSSLPIAEIGAAFTRMPLVIGSNGWHEPSGFLTPACFLSGPPE